MIAKTPKDFQSESVQFRQRLESEQPGSTKHIPETANNKHATLDEILSEHDALKKLIAGGGNSNPTAKTPAPDEVAQLKAEIARLTAENEKLSAKLASFDERVAYAAAVQIAELGFSETPKTGEKANTTGSEKLTLTQKALKAKGLPLDTKIDVKPGTQTAVEDED